VILAGRLAALPDHSGRDGEMFETLVRSGSARFERIVSPPGTASESSYWYDQTWDEFVLVVAGSAELLIDGEETPCRLAPGDWLFLPAHVRHRVERTHPTEATVWLAVHVGEPSGEKTPPGVAFSG